jgi:ribosomal protein S18 acetylase RimI-like enzyme
MTLVPANQDHFQELMTWFPDRRSCQLWATPDFPHPFTETTFMENVRPDLPSFALVGDEGELLGFGQRYLRVGRCHLARLVIAPNRRGQSLGAVLVRDLCGQGCRTLGVGVCSLFVLPDNTPALNLYRRLGFAPAAYPGERPPWGDYLIAALEDVLRPT